MTRGGSSCMDLDLLYVDNQLRFPFDSLVSLHAHGKVTCRFQASIIKSAHYPACLRPLVAKGLLSYDVRRPGVAASFDQCDSFVSFRHAWTAAGAAVIEIKGSTSFLRDHTEGGGRRGLRRYS